MSSTTARARSLVWIGRQPSKLDVPGSKRIHPFHGVRETPGAPAINSILAEPLAPDLYEILQRSIVRLLSILWEEAAWELPVAPVICQAVTAVSLSRTARIGAGAVELVLLHVAYSSGHDDSLATDREPA